MRQNLNLWGGLLMAVLMAASSAAHGGVAVGQFTGGDPSDGLDLEGDFVYALDFCEGAGGGTISYAPNVQFVPIPAGHACTNGSRTYGNLPSFGSSADDNLFESMMYRINFGWGTLAVNGSAATGLVDLAPWRKYKLQMLFHEVYWHFPDGTGDPNKRVFDIEVEGVKIVDNYDAGAPTSRTQAGVVTYTFTAADTVLNIALIGEDVGVGANALLNALTLEILPVPEPGGLGLIAFSLLAVRKRRR